MKRALTLLIIPLMVLFSNCAQKKNPIAPDSPAHAPWPSISASQAISYSGHIRAELLSKDSLHEGYDSLSVVLRDSVSGRILLDAAAQWFPLMDMGMMKHSAPVDVYGIQPGSDSLFRSGILFVMASDSSLVNGGWTLRLRINDRRYGASGSFNDSVDFRIWVRSVTPSPTVWWKGADSLWRVAALLAPKAPVTGPNDLELFIGRKASALSWPADSSWTVSFVPSMPSMGHSSPNNVNPVHIGGAHYKGRVNFTMSGDWRLAFTFTSGSFVAADTSQYIDLTVH